MLDNWTSEELTLMVEKLTERKRREVKAIKGSTKPAKVSDKELFARAGNKIKWIKGVEHGN